MNHLMFRLRLLVARKLREFATWVRPWVLTVSLNPRKWKLYRKEATWQVLRNGTPVSDVLPDHYDCLVWLVQHQPHSCDKAIREHGYEIRNLSDPAWRKQPAG